MSLRLVFVLLGAAGACLLASCRSQPESADTTVLPGGRGSGGVVFRELADSGSRVSLLDVDLATPGLELEIAARPFRSGGVLGGPARTVAEWLAERSAVAGVNGGFFGRDLEAGEKQIVGLFVNGGRAL